MTEVVLVNEKDEPIGQEEKIKAHLDAKLHRAFSILVFNKAGEWLLQKRAQGKYHSPGLWTNACCSHPRLGKDILLEAKKRLKEEMGFACPLKEIFTFVYKAKLGELTEYEFDHVFSGIFSGQPRLNKEEAEDWQWIKTQDLEKDIKKNPDRYTFWFKIIFKEYCQRYH
jgi:isopentenyl-diphosphate delta-isomerase